MLWKIIQSVKDAWILIFFLIVLMAFNGYVSLWDQDEGAYAVLANDMLENGHWLAPECQWCFIHRKPPFHFWSIALAYSLFGMNVFAVRFFTAMAVWATLWLMYKRLRNLINDTVARLSLIILGTNLLVLFIGKVALTDAWMLLFYTWSGLSLWEYLMTEKKSGLIEFYIGMALALLVKGPPFVIFGSILWVLLMIFWPDKKRIISTNPWIWGILAMFPFMFWLYETYLQNPAYIHWWLDWYVFKRIKQPVLNQTGPPGSYFLLFGLTFLAYLPFVFYAIFDVFRKKLYRGTVWLYPVLWLLSGWLVYEFLPSKLPAYVLAAYPPLSIMTAKVLYDFGKGFMPLKIKWLWVVQWIIYAFFSLAALSIYFWGLIRFHWKPVESRSLSVLITAVLFFVLIYLSVVAYQLAMKRDFIRSAGMIIYSSLLLVGGIFAVVYPLSEPLRNATKEVASIIEGRNRKEFDKILITNDFGKPPSLIFYLKKSFPGKEIIIYDAPDKDQYVLQRFGDEKSIWVITPGQYARLKRRLENLEKKFKILRVKSLNTGRIGENDYVIIFKL